MLPELIFTLSLSFSAKRIKFFLLWPQTVTIPLDLDSVMMNQHAIYLGQSSFCSKDVAHAGT